MRRVKSRPSCATGRACSAACRVRIVLAVVLLLALSSLFAIVLLRNVLLDRLDEEISVALSREAEEFLILADGIDPRNGAPFGDDFIAVFDLYLAREVPDEGETLLAFVDGELHDSEASPTAVPADRLEDAIAHWLSLRTREEGSLDTGAGEARYVAIPLSAGTHDALFVAANFPARERDEINDAVRTQGIVQFGMIVIASLLGLALAGRVLRPLSTLADTAQTISATDLTRRVPVHGEDEASRIATAFNDMLERIERANATQRRFLDDASHELRSPMTVIHGHVELLELETDPQERDAMVKIITDEIDRMNRIVEDLLLLARSERPGFLSPEPVDISELTEDVHRRASVLCGRTWRLDQTGRGRDHGRPPTCHPGDDAVRPERVRAHPARGRRPHRFPRRRRMGPRVGPGRRPRCSRRAGSACVRPVRQGCPSTGGKRSGTLDRRRDRRGARWAGQTCAPTTGVGRASRSCCRSHRSLRQNARVDVNAASSPA